MVKKAKTIPEFYMKQWIMDNFRDISILELTVDGNEGILSDKNGDTLKLQYNEKERKVYAFIE